MARYARKAVLRAHVKVPDHRPAVASEDGPPTQSVAIAVRVHENETSAILHTAGWGVGRHQGSIRFDVGDETFNRVKFLDWDGATTDVELEFIPTAAIVVIDDGDEIRIPDTEGDN